MYGIGKKRGEWGSTSFFATLRRSLAGGVLPAVLLLGLLSGCGSVLRGQGSRGAGQSGATANKLVSVWRVECFPPGYAPGGFAPVQGVIRFDPNGRYEYKQCSLGPGQPGGFGVVELSESGTYEYDKARGQLTLRGPGGVVTGPIPYHGEAEVQGPGPYGSVIVCKRIGP